MKYKTRDFGEIEIEETDIISFQQPIFGFESYHDYVLIHDREIGGHIVWLQSLEEPKLCFILMDPSALSSVYAPQLPEDIEQLLGAGEYVCWVIAVIQDDFKKTTVNLKSPIIINSETQRAAQIILEQDYPVRFFLMKEAE